MSHIVYEQKKLHAALSNRHLHIEESVAVLHCDHYGVFLSVVAVVYVCVSARVCARVCVHICVCVCACVCVHAPVVHMCCGCAYLLNIFTDFHFWSNR